MSSLIEKYNTAVPRYTSYPAVPHWQREAPSQEAWLRTLNANISEHNEISVYIHLPFCENLCTYCGCNKRITKNHAVEMPYIDAVIQEWDIYLDSFETTPVIKELHLGGGTPTFFDPLELRRLISYITSSVEVAADHSFSFEAHPNSTTAEHLMELYDLGFKRLSIGVQDVSPKILKAINRHQTVEQVRVTTELAREIGYDSINYDIIYGLPFQTEEHIHQTMDLIDEMRPDRIAFYSYAHVPWKSKGQRAYDEKDLPMGTAKQHLKDVGEARLIDMGYLTIGMDHYALPTDQLYISYQAGQMHRNFMGYTDQYTRCMIGLGASSISDCWDMYIQNEKHVEDYQRIVSTGQLPIIKGHGLTKCESETRGYILQLICQGEVTIAAIESVSPDRYLGLIKDGLVSMKNDQIKVTETGQKFIRNICAAIDPKYIAQAEQQVFSKAI